MGKLQSKGLVVCCQFLYSIRDWLERMRLQIRKRRRNGKDKIMWENIKSFLY